MSISGSQYNPPLNPTDTIFNVANYEYSLSSVAPGAQGPTGPAGPGTTTTGSRVYIDFSSAGEQQNPNFPVFLSGTYTANYTNFNCGVYGYLPYELPIPPPYTSNDLAKFHAPVDGWYRYSIGARCKDGIDADDVIFIGDRTDPGGVIVYSAVGQDGIIPIMDEIPAYRRFGSYTGMLYLNQGERFSMWQYVSDVNSFWLWASMDIFLVQ